MKTLYEIAFSNITDIHDVNEILLNSIKRNVSSKLRILHKQNDKINGVYNRSFRHYTNILDPDIDFASQFAELNGYRSLYEMLIIPIRDFQECYTFFPDSVDEGNEWFSYLEYMHFRTIPHDSTLWMYTFSKNVTLIALARGIICDIHSIPRPTIDCPDELRGMMIAFDIYKKHLENFIKFYEKRYSYKRTFSIQKEYVKVYKRRSIDQKLVHGLMDFYKNLKKKCYSIIQ
jgi:hypothetical protein